jgi:hypothetical protein
MGRRHHMEAQGQMRYLVTFSDGGTGMRHRDEPLAVGDEIEDCGSVYVVQEVEQPRTEQAPGRVWAKLAA